MNINMVEQGAATGEISEFVAIGLVADKDDDGVSLAGKTAWTAVGGANVSNADGKTNFTLSGANAAIDFDFAGDWSKFRVLLTDFDISEADKDVTVLLKNSQGKDFTVSTHSEWSESNRWSGTWDISLGKFDEDPAAENKSGVKSRGMSVLDATITGIRIRPKNPGETVSGTIKKLALVGIEAEEINVAWDDKSEFVFNTSAQTPTFQTIRTKNGTPLAVNVSGAQTTVGTSTARVELATKNPAITLKNNTKTFSITKAPISPILRVQNAAVKKGEDLGLMGLSVIGNPGNGGTIYTYSTSKNGNYSQTNVPSETGTYFVKAAIAETNMGNYSGDASRNFEILSPQIGITFGVIEWSSTTNFTYNGQPQAPTATVKDIWGRDYDVEIDGSQTNAGTHIAQVRVKDPLKHGVVLMLPNPFVLYTIAPKSLAVTWSDPKEFTFNKMVQVPRPSVTEAGVELRVTNAQTSVGKYTSANQLAPFAQIVSANAGNYTLTGYSVDYEIKRKVLEVKLDGEKFESGSTLTIPDGVANKEEYVKRLLTFDGFAKDTTGMTDKSDDESALTITLTEVGETGYAPSVRAGEKKYKVIISSANYGIAGEGGGLPIKDIKKSDGRFGIKFTSGNIVSDKAEFTVILPDNDKVLEVKAVIYDNTGNAVFEKTQNGASVSWNLTNAAGRNVANGSYLIVVEAKGTKGTYAYSAKVGVRR